MRNVSKGQLAASEDTHPMRNVGDRVSYFFEAVEGEWLNFSSRWCFEGEAA